MVTSKFMGLSPIFLSIIVASRKEPKTKNSSIFPVAFCKTEKKKFILLLFMVSIVQDIKHRVMRTTLWESQTSQLSLCDFHGPRTITKPINVNSVLIMQMAGALKKMINNSK